MSIISSIKTKLQSNPKGLYTLLYAEVCELFGRFGITALLVLYMTKTLGISDDNAFYAYSAFMALSYVTPLIGGYLSDHFLGYRFASIFGACVMLAGDVMMTVPHIVFVYSGLVVVALGFGFFMPTMTALLGQLYKDLDHKRDGGFVMYYVAKNIGALLAPIFCGLIGKYYGFNYAYILSAAVMLSGIIVFVKGTRSLNLTMPTANLEKGKRIISHLLATRSLLTCVIGVIILAPLLVLTIYFSIEGYVMAVAAAICIVYVGRVFIASALLERRNIVLILIMTVAALVFSALLGQGGTTLTLFIERLVNRNFFGATIPTSFFYTLDPVFMIVLGPFVMSIINRIRKPNYHSAALMKAMIGLLILGLGFAVFVLASKVVAHTGKEASPLFIVLAYAVFPIAELSIMPIAMSFVTKLAPEGKSAMMVGVYSFGLAAAGYFTGVISQFGQVADFTVGSAKSMFEASSIYGNVFIYSILILLISSVGLLFLRSILRKELIDKGDLAS